MIMTKSKPQHSEHSHSGSSGTSSHEGTYRLYIKNMVCDRCIMTVGDLLGNMGFEVTGIQLGEATISPVPYGDRMTRIEKGLRGLGFELARDRNDEVVTVIKSLLISYLAQVESQAKGVAPETKNGDVLSQPVSEFIISKLHRSYSSLSRAFSAHEGITIEKYLIRLRIERVKELLRYDELTLSQIAFQLGYSSVQHLSAQFRKVTGISVSEFKMSHPGNRKKLDALT